MMVKYKETYEGRLPHSLRRDNIDPHPHPHHNSLSMNFKIDLKNLLRQAATNILVLFKK